MFYKNNKNNPKILLSDKSQRGVSIVELLIVFVIIGILAALAVPNLMNANAGLQRQNVARQLKSYFERARFDSIKRNAFNSDELAKVVINSSTSFSLALDTNQNGRIENTEISNMPFASGNGVKIVGNNLIFPVTITFNNRGQAKAIDGTNAAISPIFTVCENNCTSATANSSNSETLWISPTGSADFVKTGDVYLDPAAPDISVINTGTKINPMAKIDN